MPTLLSVAIPPKQAIVAHARLTRPSAIGRLAVTSAVNPISAGPARNPK